MRGVTAKKERDSRRLFCQDDKRSGEANKGIKTLNHRRTSGEEGGREEGVGRAIPVRPRELVAGRYELRSSTPFLVHTSLKSGKRRRGERTIDETQ